MNNKNRIAFFIDGFNLFYGLKKLGRQYYKWLDLQKLAEYLINPSTDELVSVNYFTTRVIKNKRKQANQERYLSALATLNKLSFYYGEYKDKTYQCPNCQGLFTQPTEKITDVNISVIAMLGAHRKEYDTACFVTGDTDLITTMKTLRDEMNVNVKIAFPPNRKNDAIKREFPEQYRQIKENAIMHSLFPHEVKTNDGFVIKCPDQWYKKPNL